MIFKLKLPLLFCFLITIVSFSAEGQGKATVSGTIKNPTTTSVFIKQWIGSDERILDSARLDSKGDFKMVFPVGAPAKVYLHHGIERAPIYVAPGNKQKITLDASRFDETITHTGNGAAISAYLAQVDKILFDNREVRGLAFVKPEIDFVRFTDSTLAADLAYQEKYFSQKKLTKPEAAFLEHLKTDRLYAWALDRANYPSLHSMYNKLEKRYQPTEQYSEYLKMVKLHNPDALASTRYTSFVRAYLSGIAQSKYQKNENGTGPNYLGHQLQILDEELPPGVVRYTLMRDFLDTGLRKEDDLAALEAVLPKIRTEAAPWPGQLAAIEALYAARLALKPGKLAPNFTATTPEGKTISLSDFKGKVVYVDIWASWCGPCIMQIPFAKKLEEEFAGREVVFLNISLDPSEKPWIESLAKHNIQGVNARAEGAYSSQIAKAYQVSGIPQYLLIGKDGNLISAYADRPSGKAKEQIQAALEAGN